MGLYVITQYYFGFFSAFSGQTLYEPYIYQLFNITMTSLPIMYFSLFDWQFPKSTFMKQPLLYKMGMNYTEYGNNIFIQWVGLALWHGLIVYFCCLMVLNSIYIHKS